MDGMVWRKDTLEGDPEEIGVHDPGTEMRAEGSGEGRLAAAGWAADEDYGGGSLRSHAPVRPRLPRLAVAMARNDVDDVMPRIAVMEREETPPPGPLPAGGEGEVDDRGDAGRLEGDALLGAFWGLEAGAERDEWLAGLSAEELLGLGIELYNAGHFFEAHEAWEAVWLEAPRELRSFYQGLIQVTAAFVHVTRGEYPGSVRLLAEGVDKLQRNPSVFMGIELGALMEGVLRARVRLVELGERRVSEFDMGLVPPIVRVG